MASGIEALAALLGGVQQGMKNRRDLIQQQADRQYLQQQRNLQLQSAQYDLDAAKRQDDEQTYLASPLEDNLKDSLGCLIKGDIQSANLGSLSPVELKKLGIYAQYIQQYGPTAADMIFGGKSATPSSDINTPPAPAGSQNIPNIPPPASPAAPTNAAATPVEQPESPYDVPENPSQVVTPSVTGPVNGMLQQGNIDLNSRPIVKNPDGSVSTVRTISANFDGKEILIPTVSDDGRIMSNKEAVDQFLKTGKNLGTFDSIDNATAYAKQLHLDQQQQYVTDRGNQAVDWSDPQSIGNAYNDRASWFGGTTTDASKAVKYNKVPLKNPATGEYYLPGAATPSQVAKMAATIDAIRTYMDKTGLTPPGVATPTVSNDSESQVNWDNPTNAGDIYQQRRSKFGGTTTDRSKAIFVRNKPLTDLNTGEYLTWGPNTTMADAKSYYHYVNALSDYISKTGNVPDGIRNDGSADSSTQTAGPKVVDAGWTEQQLLAARNGSIKDSINILRQNGQHITQESLADAQMKANLDYPDSLIKIPSINVTIQGVPVTIPLAKLPDYKDVIDKGLAVYKDPFSGQERKMTEQEYQNLETTYVKTAGGTLAQADVNLKQAQTRQSLGESNLQIPYFKLKEAELKEKTQVDQGNLQVKSFQAQTGRMNADTNRQRLSISANGTIGKNITQWSSSIERAAAAYNLPPELIAGVIKVESGGNKNATGPATRYGRAEGLMQLMPGTARGLGVSDSYDPDQNIMGGAKYLREMLDHFHGDMRKAIAAYNAGPGNWQHAAPGYVDNVMAAMGQVKVKKVNGGSSTYSGSSTEIGYSTVKSMVHYPKPGEKPTNGTGLDPQGKVVYFNNGVLPGQRSMYHQVSDGMRATYKSQGQNVTPQDLTNTPTAPPSDAWPPLYGVSMQPLFDAMVKGRGCHRVDGNILLPTARAMYTNLYNAGYRGRNLMDTLHEAIKLKFHVRQLSL